MNISENLRSIIESSKIDGKLSGKEKEVIISKAEKEGHNRDEFEIYLDGQFQLIKSESVFKKFFKWIFKKKDRTTMFFLVLAFIGFLGFVIMRDAVIPSMSEYFTKVARGCDGVDDCIAKNKFEEATLFLNEWSYEKDVEEKKVRKAHVNYFLLNDAHEQAYVLMADYHFEASFPNREYIKERYNQEAEWFNQIIESIIIESENDKELLIKVINLIKPIAEKDIRKSKRDKERDHFNKNDSRKKELMKKYKLD
ncbi:MAG: hypothetical protein P8N07_02540 [Flavobacteriales bacterium]|nr:hypothetical protein [Flavobacteriales bacterium]